MLKRKKIDFMLTHIKRKKRQENKTRVKQIKNKK